MEQCPRIATLSAYEWSLIHDGFLPAARANAERGTYGAYGSLAGDQWMFWLAQDAEAGTDGLVAICNSTDGSVTSFAINPVDESIKRVHVSADVPDIKWGTGEVFNDLGAALREQNEDNSIGDVLGHVGFQTELGLDVPVGDELQPLQIVMAETAALYGVAPDQAGSSNPAPMHAHVVGSVFLPAS